MSGRFYQRYVPPAAKEPASSTGTKSPKSHAQPVNQFFKRYEPPPVAAQSGSHEIERPAKRRKHDDKALPHREKTFKKAADIVEAGPGENGFEKHQGLREKFEKAQKRSDKQRENDIERESEQNDDDKQTATQYGLQPLPQPINEEPAKVSRADPLPTWLENPVKANKDDRISMSELHLSDKLCENLRKGNFTEAFAIQSTVIPMLLPGKSHHDGDVCVSASTGSGKTLSYVLPMVEALREKPVRLLRGLIVVPTRELVNQVRETLEICTAGTKVKVGVAVGSRNLAEERKHLLERQVVFDPDGHKAVQRRKAHKLSIEDLMDWDRGSEDEYDPPYAHVAGLVSSIDVLVCTPGRLVDHVRSTKGFHLHDVQWLVIDEADRLLDQSFQQWIDTIVPELKWLPRLDEEEQALRSLWRMPRRRRVQKVILSATMTRDISKLLSLELRRPKMVVLDRDVNATEQEQPATAFKLPSELREVAVKVGNSDQKPLALVQLLETLLENSGSRPNGHNADKDRMDVDTSDDDSSSNDDEDDHDDSDSEDSASSTSDQSDVSTSSSGSESDSSGTDSTSDTDLASQSNRTLKQQSRSGKQHGVLIFTNTNESAQRLSRLLGLMKSDWQSHIGTLSKSTASSLSRRLLSAFRAGRLSILIASDRASRGLDIKDLPAVVNYDMPTSALSYIHRVGRTARAGSAGTAYTFVAHHEARWFWAEIGKSEAISRSGRIARQEDLGGKDVPERLMADYKSSLEKLGEEARGF